MNSSNRCRRSPIDALMLTVETGDGRASRNELAGVGPQRPDAPDWPEFRSLSQLVYSRVNPMR